MSIDITLNTYDYLLEKNLLNHFIKNRSQISILSLMNKLIKDLETQTEISRLNFIHFYSSYLLTITNTQKQIIKTVFSIIKYYKNDNDKLRNILEITYNYLSNDTIYSYMFLIEIINNYEQFIEISDTIHFIIESIFEQTKNCIQNNTYHIISNLFRFVNLTHNLITKFYINTNNNDMIYITQLFSDVLYFKITPEIVITNLENYNFKKLDKCSLLIMNDFLIYGLNMPNYIINKITSLLLIKMIYVINNHDDLYDFLDKYIDVINNRINNITEEMTRTYYNKLNQFLLNIKKNNTFINNEINIHNKEYIDDIVNILISNYNYDLDIWIKYLSCFMSVDKIKIMFENKIDIIPKENNSNLTHFYINIYFKDKKLFDFSKKSLIIGSIYGIIGNNRCGKTTLFKRLEQNNIENLFNITLKKVILVKLNSYDNNFTIGDELSILNHIDLIHKFSLSIDYIINNLNYFMKYRFELLKAIIQNPDVIILDEPLINTDRVNTKWLNELILNTPNITWIISSNNYDFINYTCTHNFKIQNYKLSKCHKLVEPSIINNVRVYDFDFTIINKDESILIKVENISNEILINPFSIDLNAKSRIAILGHNCSGKTNLIKLLIGLNKPTQGNVFINNTLSLGFISQTIIDELSEHSDKTPIEYFYWRYKKGYDKLINYQENMNITNSDFNILRKSHIIEGNSRLINKLTGYRKLNEQNEFLYELSWLGLSDENNSWFTYSQLIDMGMTTFIENIIARFNRNKAINMDKLTNYELSIYLNKWDIESNTIGNLSSSEKMRFILAATCWKNPDIIVIDEPTNYLDNCELINLSNFIKTYPGGLVIATNNEKFGRENMNIFLELYDGRVIISSN